MRDNNKQYFLGILIVDPKSLETGPRDVQIVWKVFQEHFQPICSISYLDRRILSTSLSNLLKNAWDTPDIF